MTVERMSQLLDIAGQEGFLLEGSKDPFLLDVDSIEWILSGRREPVVIKIMFKRYCWYGKIELSDADFFTVNDGCEIYFDKITSEAWREAKSKFKKELKEILWSVRARNEQ